MASQSKQFGNLFEQIFLTKARSSGITITRIPDGCRQVGRKLIRVKTPCDWILTYKSKTALIDTKTTHGSIFTTSMITEHQAIELSNHEAAGAIAGYIVWLRLRDIVIFIPGSVLVHALTTKTALMTKDLDILGLCQSTFDLTKVFK